MGGCAAQSGGWYLSAGRQNLFARHFRGKHSDRQQGLWCNYAVRGFSVGALLLGTAVRAPFITIDRKV
jgi:hypothetical protein